MKGSSAMTLDPFLNHEGALDFSLIGLDEFFYLPVWNTGDYGSAVCQPTANRLTTD